MASDMRTPATTPSTLNGSMWTRRAGDCTTAAPTSVACTGGRTTLALRAVSIISWLLAFVSSAVGRSTQRDDHAGSLLAGIGIVRIALGTKPTSLSRSAACADSTPSATISTDKQDQRHMALPQAS